MAKRKTKQKEALPSETTKEPKKKKPVNGRQKGAKFERETAKLLTDWWGESFHRVPASGGLRWGKDNRVSGDIVAPPDSDFPFNIECKKQEGWDFDQVIKGTGDVVDWWEQCVRDAGNTDRVPLLVFTRNFAPIYFMLRYGDFVKLMGNEVKTNYFLTTITLKDGALETVGIGYFSTLTEIPKEVILERLT